MAQAPNGGQGSNTLIWIDLEMTGLNSETDRVIEVATIVTDSQLNVLAEGPILAVHQSDAILNGMDDWNKRTHAATGLIERVKLSNLTEVDVERLTIDFLRQYVAKTNRRCAAAASVRTDVFSRAACRSWRPGFTTAIWT